VKTSSERFAGAVDTYCIEALMQDGRALQAGTSHFLGQNFAKAFDCRFQNRKNELEYVWATSWGVSTRLIGALVMTHSDDQGLVLPPRLAPVQVVIIPIFRNDAEKATVLESAERIKALLSDSGIRVKLDASEAQRPGWKFNEYEVRGVPVRLAIGPRDVQKESIELARRDTRSKEIVSQNGLVARVKETLDLIQDALFERALAFRESHTTRVDTYEEFKDVLDSKGGFVLAHWDGTDETEERIKNETKATIRCIPLDQEEETGIDLVTGKPSEGRVYFARAY
jgi:prolyl-tRNA synthetase